MRFPNITASDLNRKVVRLPGDFAGDYNIILIPFYIEQQAQVDTWTPLLARLTALYPALRVYEVPTLPQYNWFQQQWIDNGMRSGIRDPRQRAATITLYTDVRAFLSALNLPDTATTYALLVDRTGKVYWRGSGSCTPEKGASLTEVLETLALTSATL
jgi:hypothetical protein